MAKKNKPRSTPSPQPNAEASQAGTAQKQSFRFRTTHAAGLLTALWALFFHRILLGSAHLWEDMVKQEFPHRLFARDALLSFQFPHWNPFTFGGMPFFPALHTGVFYPFNFLLSFVPVSEGTFWYLLQLVVLVHLLIGGLCMLLYLRSHRLSRATSLLAAVGYMLCGFFVTKTIHSMMLYIVAWIPLIMLLMDRAIMRRSISYAIFAGLLLGVTIFAGHPQITMYEFLFLGAYGLWRWFDQPQRRYSHLVYLAVPFILAVGISMVQLLPAFELSGQSARVEWTFEQAAEGSVSIRQLLTFVMPKVFGAWTGARSGPGSQVPPFWLTDSFHSGYYTYWETTFYTGIAILLLGMVQLVNIRRSRFVLFAAIWGAFSLAVALGNHFFVYWLLYKFVPGFGQFRGPARMLFTWNILLPVMAAYTLNELRDPEKARRLRKPLLIGAGILLAIGMLTGLGILRALWPELQDQRLASWAARQGWILALHAALLLGLALLFFNGKISLRSFTLAVTAALALDLFMFGFGQHQVENGGAPAYFNQNREIAANLEQAQDQEISRANMRQFALEPDEPLNRKTGLMILKKNQGPIDRVQLLEGYNPLQLYRRLPPLKGRDFGKMLDLLNVRYYIDRAITPQELATRSPILYNARTLPRAKFFYRARVLESDSLVKKTMLAGDFDHRNELLLTEKPSISLDQADTLPPRNSVEITRYGNNSIELSVETQKDGLLWLSEIWYPAWKAYIDGQQTRVLNADYSFRAIEVPAGSHTVTMLYRSGYFFWGGVITLLSLIAAGVVLGAGFRKRK